ncbi:hypothetical protein VTJ49DRAFT_3191 [Mycothermus thermophilus]|uniref:Spindle assembly checkpoint component MAD1 n=1 Tax=Humicola insolens TaxID=85995 RepID=A0ABR3VNE0_HUMIN
MSGLEMDTWMLDSANRVASPTDQATAKQAIGLDVQSAVYSQDDLSLQREHAGSDDRDHTRISLWLPEILSQICGMACLTAIVFLLWHFDGNPPPDFGRGFTLNTLLAFLTSLARACFLVPIIEGIGQLKWLWFSSRRHRPLIDFQRFDDATRGGLGGFKLLFSFNGFLASFGAVIMLSGLVTSTLTQQAINYVLVQDVSHDRRDTATVQRATLFSTYNGNGLAITPYDTARLQKAIFEGTFSPPTDGVPHVRPVCSSGECTWPAYSSLAICGGVANLTERDDTELLAKLHNLTEKRWAVLSNSSHSLFSALGYGDRYYQTIPRVFPIIIGHLDKPSGAFNQSVVDLIINDSFLAYTDEVVNNTLNDGGTLDMSRTKYLEVALWWCTKTYSTNFTAGQPHTEALAELTQLDDPNKKGKLNVQWEPAFYLCYQNETCNNTYGGAVVNLAVPPGSVFDEVNKAEVSAYPVHQWTALTASALVTATMFDSALMDSKRGVITSNGGGVGKAFAYSLLGDFQATEQPPPEEQIANVDTLVSNLARALTNMVREGNTRLNATDASAVVTGTVFTPQSRVEIHWKWLAMLSTQLVLTGIFLAVTVAATRAERVQVLKGSSLAALCALDGDAREKLEGIDGLDGLGRRAKEIPSFRASTTSQPSYNFLTGEPTTMPTPGSASAARPASRQSAAPPSGPSPPRGRAVTVTPSSFSRESSKENRPPADAEGYENQRRRIEELKAEVGTLQYQINNYEQERELARLQMENEMRDARRRAEDDFKAKQAAEAERARAMRQVESLQRELEELREEKERQKRELEAKARDAQEEARVLQEQLEELSDAKDDAARLAEREAIDLKAKLAASQRTVHELEEEAHARDDALDKAQSLLAERDETIGRLEADVLRLKAQTGDAETIAVIRRELSDQVTHIRNLEAKNREQATELKHLRQVHKAVEVVEEEKRTLQRRLEAAEAMEQELNEERRQRQRLEDDRRAWAAYLQNEGAGGDEFDSPEAVARALVAERLRSASLVEKLGELQPEIADRDNIIKALEDEKTKLQAQIEQLRTSGGSGASAANDKARARLDRQRALAVKEVEYLRAQLKTYEMEDLTVQPETVDQQKVKRIQELEDLVDKYKAEVATLHADLTSLESASTSPAQPVIVGTKRGRDDSDNSAEHEQLGQLARKNRKLQAELSELQTAHRLLRKEHEVATSQLASAREQLQTRILSLRSNPTSDHEAVKASTLAALKRENAELLALIERKPANFPTIPASQLAAAKREVEAALADAASAHKSARRLKEVWASKSAEFKEAVFSTLGWTVSFLPGGKMRVESVYYPSRTDEHENSIVFDGEKGTMKVGGGPRSAFAQRIGESIQFWVRERGCVPCFLAALTLEFWEEQNNRGETTRVEG